MAVDTQCACPPWVLNCEHLEDGRVIVFSDALEYETRYPECPHNPGAVPEGPRFRVMVGTPTECPTCKPTHDGGMLIERYGQTDDFAVALFTFENEVARASARQGEESV